MSFPGEKTVKMAVQSAIALISVNAILTLTLLAYLYFSGSGTTTVDPVDFAVEGFSALTYFFMFSVVVFTSVRAEIRNLALVGLYIIQNGRLIDALDEVRVFNVPHWSVVGDGLTLVGEILLVIAAVRWVILADRRANTDPLTALFNRRYHENELERMVSGRGAGANSFAIVAMDLDHFKSINDTHGHAVGDDALRHTAKLLRQTCRQVDIISRVGGEEFEVLIPNCDKAQALMIAERIRRHFEATPPAPIERMTASLGVAISQDGDTLSSIRERADKAVYTSKKEGRNRVSYV